MKGLVTMTTKQRALIEPRPWWSTAILVILTATMAGGIYLIFFAQNHISSQPTGILVGGIGILCWVGGLYGAVFFYLAHYK